MEIKSAKEAFEIIEDIVATASDLRIRLSMLKEQDYLDLNVLSDLIKRIGEDKARYIDSIRNQILSKVSVGEIFRVRKSDGISINTTTYYELRMVGDKRSQVNTLTIVRGEYINSMIYKSFEQVDTAVLLSIVEGKSFEKGEEVNNEYSANLKLLNLLPQ